MVEVVFALLLLQDHKIIEHRYHDSLQSCLKSKANIEIYMGEKKITSLILE